MAGQGAARRANAKRAKAKRERKNVAKQQAQQHHDHTGLAVPAITEDHLLAFQVLHFGDDTKPDTFFVDAETALYYDPAAEDDDLGYYADGVKRTLTDEQIAMFRHTEREALLRAARLAEAEEPGKDALKPLERQHESDQHCRTTSPAISQTSSVEGDLLGLSRPTPSKVELEAERSSHPPPGQRSSSVSTATSQHKKKRRKKEVPYNQRHKRSWEDYIEDQDPIQGSLTSRRIARDMDTQDGDDVDLDY